MKIAVVGAGGLTGRHIVAQALDAGYLVNGLTRTPEKYTYQHDHLFLDTVNIFNLEKLTDGLSGCDAIICVFGLGSMKQAKKSTMIYSKGILHVIDAMKTQGIKRLITLSSRNVVNDPTEPFFHKYLVKPFFKEIYQDMKKMEHILANENELDWTVIRLPKVVKGEKGEPYRTAVELMPAKGKQIARPDLADFVIKQIHDKEFIQKIATISY